jgi:hypothetical protein
MERFSLKKLNETEGKEQYQVKISSMLAYNMTSSQNISLWW